MLFVPGQLKYSTTSSTPYSTKDRDPNHATVALEAFPVLRLYIRKHFGMRHKATERCHEIDFIVAVSTNLGSSDFVRQFAANTSCRRKPAKSTRRPFAPALFFFQQYLQHMPKLKLSKHTDTRRRLNFPSPASFSNYCGLRLSLI